MRFNCLLPEDKHAVLFSNVEQIRDVNRTLLELMEQSTIGQAFKHLGPFLKLYAMYANNHQQALTLLQVSTIVVDDDISNREMNGKLIKRIKFRSI